MHNDQEYLDTPPDVESWFNTGVKRGATHMYTVHDGETLGPVYVMPLEDGSAVENRCWIAGHVQQAYDLSYPYDQQTGKYTYNEFWTEEYLINNQQYYDTLPKGGDRYAN